MKRVEGRLHNMTACVQNCSGKLKHFVKEIHNTMTLHGMWKHVKCFKIFIPKLICLIQKFDTGGIFHPPGEGFLLKIVSFLNKEAACYNVYVHVNMQPMKLHECGGFTLRFRTTSYA